METITKTLYHFDDLDDDAKENARGWLRQGYPDYEWYDAVFDDAKQIAELMGINIKDIYFSGFYSQGDGAMFTGDYSYRKNSVKDVTEYAPIDKELHRIVKALQQQQKINFYQVSATIEHSGHYYHKYCSEIRIYRENSYGDCLPFIDDSEDVIIELLRDFMDWIYKQLETDYEYLVSDECIDETLRINNYTFDIKGHPDH